jgi:hypothetical protein
MACDPGGTDLMRGKVRKTLDVSRARAALQASLDAPSRDHAGQIAALRAAVANTSTATPERPLGILLWPGGFPLHAIPVDLGILAKRFRCVRHDVISDWRHLFGADRSTLVFDPFSVSRGGRFGHLIRERGFARVITGLEACRAAALGLMPEACA